VIHANIIDESSFKNNEIIHKILPQGFGDGFRVMYNIKLELDGTAIITRQQSLYGSLYNSRKRLYAEITPENRHRRHQELVSSIAQSARPTSPLSDNFKSYPGIESFRIKVPGFAVRDGDYYYCKLPGLNILKGLIRTDGEDRENPYFIDTSYHFEIKYEITAPNGFKAAVMLPQNKNLQIPGAMVVGSSTMNNGRCLVLVTGMLTPSIIKAANYYKLVKMNAALNSPELELIILKKTK